MTADLATLTGLLERVRAATGPSETLDDAIMAALYLRDGRFIGARDYYSDEPVKDDVWVDPRTDRWVTNRAFGFTAEERHCERLIGFLPGACWQVCTTTPDPTRPGHSGRAWAKIQPCLANDDGWRIGARDCTAPTLPLALTATALMCLVAQAEALIAQAQTEEGRHGGSALPLSPARTEDGDA